jgi:Protein of unknown function (DUF3224)
MERATGSFQVRSWDENTYEELEGGGKLTLASVEYALRGDIEGEGTVRWLMVYQADGTAHYTGLQRVRGSIAGRKGSFVVETVGDFDGELAAGTWEIVPGSGTGALAGISGKGTGRAPSGAEATYQLDYDLDDDLA